MKSYAIGLVALVLAGTGVTHAQEAAPPPVLRDIPETETLPKDGVFDLLGIRLGSTKEEVLAKLKELAPDADPTKPPVVSVLGDNRGNRFRYLEESQEVSVDLVNPDGTKEDISVRFTTRVSGVRAMGMERTVRYPDHAQGSVPAILASLEKKYGPPSYIERKSGIVFVQYIWQGRQRVQLTAAQYGARPIECFYSGTVPPYQYSGRRSAASPACPIQMTVQIDIGKRNDLASRMKFSLIDRLRIHQNQRAMDQWLRDEMDKVVKGQTGAQPPRL